MAAKQRGTSSTVGAQKVTPTYTSFPKPRVEAQDTNPFSPENISIRQKGELRDAEAAKKKKAEADAKPKMYKAMTGPRNIAGGDIGALSVLNALYDSPVIRMFIAASRARVK